MIKNPVERAKWDIQRNKLLAKYSFLTPEDLSFNDGNKDAMLENLQIKLCVSPEDLNKILLKL